MRKRLAQGISSGMPGPHDFAVRAMAFVRAIKRCDMARPSHPTPRVVTIAKRPSRRGGMRHQTTVSEKKKVLSLREWMRGRCSR
jgi:hypothetical protein